MTNHTVYFFKNSKLVKKIENENDIIIAREYENLLYVGVRGNGLFIYDKKNNFKLLHHYFKHLTVTGINKQERNGFWISTLENGIYYVHNFKSINFRLNDIGLNKIKSIQSIDKYKYFFLNSKEQIYFQNNEQLEKLPFKGYSKLNLHGNILNVGSKECTFYNIKSKKIYIYFDYFFRLEVSYNKLERVDENDYILSHTGIWDFKKLIFEKVIKSNRLSTAIYISKKHILTFKYDKFRKGFWFSRIDGIYFVDLKKNLTYFGKDFKTIKSRVNEFEIDENQNLWCATRGQGICKISKDLKITHFDSKNGLLSNNCKTIELDKHQNLWVGTTKGMNVIFNKSNTCAPSFLINQFVNEEILDIHFNNNTLFVGTDKGLLKFDDLLLTYFNQSLICLNKLNVIGNEKNSNYNLNFSCNFQDPSSFRKWILEYRIPSVSDKWIQTKKSEIEVTDLPSGKHNIEIRALSNAGYSKNTIKKSFYIPPKYYQTWWFFALIIISIFLIFYIFYKLIQSQTKKRERKKQEIQLMLSQMESKALRAQMNPHFIFNAMNSIQNFLLSDQEIEAVTFLGKFARLIRNILESTKSELITIKNEKEILETYIELEQLRCSYSFDFKFNIDESISLEASQIPSMIIQPFIENAIIHGLIPLTERKGLLQISFTQDVDYFYCTIEDNGIGRKQAQINNEKNRKFHTSMGMGITFDRIEQIKKCITRLYLLKLKIKWIPKISPWELKFLLIFQKFNCIYDYRNNC